jgi:CRP-like cAMP-binding protein
MGGLMIWHTSWLSMSLFFDQLGSTLHRKLILLLLFLLSNFLELAAPLFLLDDHEVFKKTVGQVLAHLLILLSREFEVIVHSVEVTVKTGLKSETVHNVELAPHHDSSCLQLRLFQTELT